MLRFFTLLAFIIIVSSCAGNYIASNSKINAGFHEACKGYGFKSGTVDYLDCIAEQEIEFKKSLSATRLEEERRKSEELRREREIMNLRHCH